MSLRIAFDLDGVLADMDSQLVRQSEIALAKPLPRDSQEARPAVGSSKGAEGPDPTPDFVPPVIQLSTTRRQQRQLWEQV
ncbi:MAG: hypothetical protein ACRD2I_00515, partial [Vicinamibacterales bacterium]